jgi:hypothetical protein
MMSSEQRVRLHAAVPRPGAQAAAHPSEAGVGARDLHGIPRPEHRDLAADLGLDARRQAGSRSRARNASVPPSRDQTGKRLERPSRRRCTGSSRTRVDAAGPGVLDESQGRARLPPVALALRLEVRDLDGTPARWPTPMTSSMAASRRSSSLRMWLANGRPVPRSGRPGLPARQYRRRRRACTRGRWRCRTRRRPGQPHQPAWRSSSAGRGGPVRHPDDTAADGARADHAGQVDGGAVRSMWRRKPPIVGNRSRCRRGGTVRALPGTAPPTSRRSRRPGPPPRW